MCGNCDANSSGTVEWVEKLGGENITEKNIEVEAKDENQDKFEEGELVEQGHYDVEKGVWVNYIDCELGFWGTSTPRKWKHIRKCDLKVGDRVGRRDEGEEWATGKIIELSPFKLLVSYNDHEEQGLEWEYVRKAPNDDAELLKITSIIRQIQDARDLHEHGSLKEVNSSKAMVEQLRRLPYGEIATASDDWNIAIARLQKLATIQMKTSKNPTHDLQDVRETVAEVMQEYMLQSGLSFKPSLSESFAFYWTGLWNNADLKTKFNNMRQDLTIIAKELEHMEEKDEQVKQAKNGGQLKLHLDPLRVLYENMHVILLKYQGLLGNSNCSMENLLRDFCENSAICAVLIINKGGELTTEDFNYVKLSATRKMLTSLELSLKPIQDKLASNDELFFKLFVMVSQVVLFFGQYIYDLIYPEVILCSEVDSGLD